MWELICDYAFRWGPIAADRSLWRCDGSPLGLQPLPDGRVQFVGPQSRIAIKRTTTGPWVALTGLRVEMTLRFAAPHGHLIYGDQSFRLFMGAYGVLYADCGGDTINTYADRIPNAPENVPTGRWVRITLEHNGFNRIQLFFDDTLVAARGVAGMVPGVGPQGVWIGNSIANAGDFFHGDLDAVKVWRINPRKMEQDFSARPLDPALAECWDEFFRRLAEAYRRHPDCARWLVAALADLMRQFWLALGKKSAAKIEEFHQMGREYHVLWRAGRIDSPEMLTTVTRFRNWLFAEGLFDPADPRLKAILAHRCFQLLLKEIRPPDCDPQFVALLRAIAGGGKSATAH